MNFLKLKNLNTFNKNTKGLYLLVLSLKKKQKITAGKLPQTTFPSGIYFYIGRAKHGISGRIKRHLKKKKKLFWHIDYLLRKAKIEDVWIKPDSFEECQVADKIKNFTDGFLHPQKKFGSSDCRCPSHLLYIPDHKVNLISLREKMGFERIDFDRTQV